jgi:hypothetical protein
VKRVLLATGLVGAALGCSGHVAVPERVDVTGSPGRTLSTAAVGDGVRERFPTEDHKRYPLATVHEYSEGKKVSRLVPYREPPFAERCRRRWKRFAAMRLPLTEEESDVARYSSGSAHKYGVIPVATFGVPEDRKTDEHKKFVYSADGRIRNTYYKRGEDGSWILDDSVFYCDEERYLVHGTFDRKGEKLSAGHVCEYPAGDEPLSLDLAPVVIARMTSEGRVHSYEIWSEGAWVRSVHIPQPPLVYEHGKWPCQARRYRHEVKALVSAPGLSEAERVRAILKYTKYGPLGNEEPRRGGSGYSTLQYYAVACLGKLDGKESQAALLGLLEDRKFRMSATMALAEQGDASILPSLVKALELEDGEARTRPPSFADRNRHLVTGWIVRSMLRLSPGKSEGMLRRFLEERQRVYRRTIDRGLAR